MKIRFLLLAGMIMFSSSTLFAGKFVPSSDLISKVLSFVNQAYVDHSRIVPDKMLEGSLNHLSTSIAPVLTKSETENGHTRVTISVDQSSKTFRFEKPKTVTDLDRILQKIAKFTKPSS